MDQTQLKPNVGWEVGVTAHKMLDDTQCPDHEVPKASIQLFQIGWLDQKGRVYLTTPPSKDFDGGSLTPLLINPGCD